MLSLCRVAFVIWAAVLLWMLQRPAVCDQPDYDVVYDVTYSVVRPPGYYSNYSGLIGYYTTKAGGLDPALQQDLNVLQIKQSQPRSPQRELVEIAVTDGKTVYCVTHLETSRVECIILDKAADETTYIDAFPHANVMNSVTVDSGIMWVPQMGVHLVPGLGLFARGLALPSEDDVPFSMPGGRVKVARSGNSLTFTELCPAPSRFIQNPALSEVWKFLYGGGNAGPATDVSYTSYTSMAVLPYKAQTLRMVPEYYYRATLEHYSSSVEDEKFHAGYWLRGYDKYLIADNRFDPPQISRYSQYTGLVGPHASQTSESVSTVGAAQLCVAFLLGTGAWVVFRKRQRIV